MELIGGYLLFSFGAIFGAGVMAMFCLGREADIAITHVDQSQATAGGDIVGGNKDAQ